MAMMTRLELEVALWHKGEGSHALQGRESIGGVLRLSLHLRGVVYGVGY